MPLSDISNTITEDALKSFLSSSTPDSEKLATTTIKTLPEAESKAVALIKHYAELYRADEMLALNIAYAESQFRNVPNYLYDGEKGYRTAYGIFQITRTTFKAAGCGDPKDRMDIELNIKCGVKMLADGGYGHWSESALVGYGGGWLRLPYNKKIAESP